jgi:hypothetical protein
MHELYAVIGFFILIGLLVSRMKREERNVRTQVRHSPLKELRSANTMSFRDMSQGRLSSSMAAGKELAPMSDEREEASLPI